MRFLSLRERDLVSVGPSGVLSEREADGISLLERFMPRGMLSWEHHGLRFGPFCGVLRTPDVAIELLPKIERPVDTTSRTRGLLVAMLIASGELRASKVGQTTLESQDKHLLDVFVDDFCSQVEAAAAKGAIARYIECTENLTAVRGRVRLTEHLRRNAFDQSRLYCRFDERTIDNPYNRALKGVLRLVREQSRSPVTRAMVTSLLHRLAEVQDRPVQQADIGALQFDRTNDHWRNVFDHAKRLLSGLFPDIRFGDASGSALLFNMERLFEAVLGQRLQRAYLKLPTAGIRVELQGPQRLLAASGFQLRPDIAVLEGADVVGIADAKWKQLDPGAPNADVSSSDAYQMNAYASRYQCSRLTLVYPASAQCPPGHVREFRLQTPGRPILDVVAVDIYDLAFGSGVPFGLESVAGSRQTIASVPPRS